MTAENNNSAWIATDSRPTRLLLVRHGVTAYSIEKRFAGRSDLELLPLGHAQAARAATRVAELGPVDALYSSPLLRTRQTADALADRLGLTVQLEPELVEADYGDWDGNTFDEIRQFAPDTLAAWLADPDLAPPGGETQLAVTARVRQAQVRIVAREPERTVAVVTHVSPIKALVQTALGAPDSAVHRMYLAPASISIIDYFPDGPTSLRAYNETAHLTGL